MTLDEEMKVVEAFDEWRQGEALEGHVATVDAYRDHRRLEVALDGMEQIQQISWDSTKTPAERLQLISDLIGGASA